MSYQAEVIKVLIASPSDVANERVAIPEVIYSWNAINSEENKIVMLPIKWETHSTPEIGDRPQALINKQLVKDCDILVGAFWTRIGTHTGVAKSGTVEEINEFIEAGKHVLLYFSSQPIEPDSIDLEQYKQLKEFKTEMLKKGLVETYSNISEFREKVNRHLTATTRKIAKDTESKVLVAETPTPRNELAMAKEQLLSFLDRFRLTWVSERDSTPLNVNSGKGLLRDFGSQLIEHSQMLNGRVEDKIIADIQEIILNTRKIQNYLITMDGGESFGRFWRSGDSILDEMQHIAENI
ncbi:DUF4062 domain-containing protein [Paenibacillus sp. LHD-38]|uniref:DUF4062 domain-containing protein n=1 Tax=Paenibacillus sp. LHD-38 TaxID=3072143 RepID=UPI00280F5AB2|nr:DUF4062 domain-containing protein [Paenibacillus sp. LHD-38]MDQ8735810.1 DUF4062 domain-containing protein [Paenibacillus sp. LHD-38]